MAKPSDCQRVVLGQATVAAVAPKDLLEIQILASHPRLTESESLGVVPDNLGITSSSSDSDAQLKFEDHKVSGQKFGKKHLQQR